MDKDVGLATVAPGTVGVAPAETDPDVLDAATALLAIPEVTETERPVLLVARPVGPAVDTHAPAGAVALGGDDVHGVPAPVEVVGVPVVETDLATGLFRAARPVGRARPGQTAPRPPAVGRLGVTAVILVSGDAGPPPVVGVGPLVAP